MDILLWEQIPEDAKESSPQGRPEEEIARFTVDEHLSDSERINLFLIGGHAVQQRKAIDSIPTFLKSKGRPGWELVKANLLQTLPKLDLEAQVAVAEALATAVQWHALLSADVAECLLPLAVDYVKRDRPEEESGPWLVLLLYMLPVLPSKQLLDVVLPLAQSKGQVNESVLSRVSCCRLLGGMAPHVSSSDVSARFASQLLAACQDTDYQVRIAAAQQLPVLARVLPTSVVTKEILPELKELLEDDEVQVRVSGLSSLMSLCQLLPRETHIRELLPLVRKHMQPLELALPLQRALAAGFPQLLEAIRDDLEPSDAGLIYGCFRHLAARTDGELRRTCASKLPALMSCPLPGSSATYLHDTWTDLALDHDVQVRTAIASQFHEVARSVSAADAAQLLRRPLVALLKDTAPEVRTALLPGLAYICQTLAGVDDRHKDIVASDVNQALLVVLGSINNNWRCKAQLAAALPALTGLLSADALSDQWTPFAFNLLFTGAASVKPAAATGLMHLLRSSRRERQRTELYCKLIRELAWGKSCWARLAYIQLCAAALPLFSCRWVKDHLLEGLVQMLGDTVPNVRLAALALLPAMKQVIRLPEDVERLEQLNSAMSNLMTDNDRDVSHAARSVHDTFKRTPLRMTGGAGLLDMNGTAAGVGYFEASELAKEQYEVEQLTFSIEELEKLRIEYMAMGADKRGRRLPGTAADSSGSGSAANSSNSNPGSSSYGTLSRKNSRGRSDPHSAGGITSNSRTNSWDSQGSSGSGGGSRGGGSLRSLSWSPDKKFGSGGSTTSSSSSAAAGSAGLNLKALIMNSNSSSSKGAAPRGSSGGFSGSSGSSYGTYSPRHGSAGSSSPVSKAAYSGGFGPASGSSAAVAAAMASPTGSGLMGNLRLPVLAGSPKGAVGPGGSSSSIGSPSAVTSRLGVGAFGSSGYTGGGAGGSAGSGVQLSRPPGALGSSTAAAAAAAAAAPSSSLFRHGSLTDSKNSSSASSRASSTAMAAGAGKFGSSGSSMAVPSTGNKQQGTSVSRLLGSQGSSAAGRRFK